MYALASWYSVVEFLELDLDPNLQVKPKEHKAISVGKFKLPVD